MKAHRRNTALPYALILFITTAFFIPVSPLFSLEEGIASWYGGKFHGRKTANGEIFDTRKFTAAHRSLAFNTKVKVTNLDNGRSTIVRINDRGPFVQGRIIDLSQAAAESLDMIHAGTARVRLEILGQAEAAAAGRPAGAAPASEAAGGDTESPPDTRRTAAGRNQGVTRRLPEDPGPVPGYTASSVGTSGGRGRDPLASIPLPEPELPEVITFGRKEAGTGPVRRTGAAETDRTPQDRSEASGTGEAAPARSFTIQVGSFAEAENAYRMKNFLESRGFNPRFEPAQGGVTRVILPNIVSVRLQDTQERLKEAGITEYLVRQVW